MVDTGRITQEHDAIMSDFSLENDMPKCTWWRFSVSHGLWKHLQQRFHKKFQSH